MKAAREPRPPQEPRSEGAIIRVRQLVNRFGNQLVHDHIDLTIHQGEVLGIVGGSGSGKSVLMRSLLGLHQPDGGHIEVEGLEITTAPAQEVRRIRYRSGVLFQSGALFSSLSVADNIQVPIRAYTSLSPQLCRELALLKMKLVGLSTEAANKFPSELSGGMKKRAALARAIILDPALLFLDEPTAGLDPIAAAEFDDLILYLQKHLGLTVVMITHDLDSLFRICNRVAVLVDRKLVVGTLGELLKHPHPWIRRYFHGARARAAQPPPIR